MADDGTATLTQTLTNDAGSTDLVDSQYLLFNLVALAYVIVGLASTNQLPAIPAVLLALTGASAATYVLNKALQNDSPTVSSVVPSSFRPGDRITITGSNFKPAGTPTPPVVTVGGKQALVDANATDGRINVIAAPGTSPGAQDLVVIRGVNCPAARRIAWWFGHPLKSGGERGPGGWECFNGHLPSRVMFSCARGRARGIKTFPAQ